MWNKTKYIECGSIPKSVVYIAILLCHLPPEVYIAILLCHLPPEEYHPTAERSTSSHTVAVFGMMVLFHIIFGLHV